jgi:hypothetical protein
VVMDAAPAAPKIQGSQSIIASGGAINANNPNRTMLKRIIPTGYPVKVKKAHRND